MLNYNSAFRLSDLESIHTIKKIKKNKVGMDRFF